MGELLHLVQQGGSWVGCSPTQASPCCNKCNSLPINSQCTNFILSDVAVTCGHQRVKCDFFGQLAAAQWLLLWSKFHVGNRGFIPAENSLMAAERAFGQNPC